MFWIIILKNGKWVLSRVSTKQSILVGYNCLVLHKMTFFAQNLALFLYQFKTSFQEIAHSFKINKKNCTKFCMHTNFKSEFLHEINTGNFCMLLCNAYVYEKLKFLHCSIVQMKTKLIVLFVAFNVCHMVWIEF